MSEVMAVELIELRNQIEMALKNIEIGKNIKLAKILLQGSMKKLDEILQAEG